ncbi:MAG: cytochrome-c peroxidase, partial [Pedobacter sp.]|nr:cytochrome-c peroxidase [Pedobacter sp.]
MKRVLCGLAISLGFLLFLSFRTIEFNGEITPDSLRKLYSKPTSEWPKPTIDPGVDYQELGVVPPSPLDLDDQKVKDRVALGRILFFDPRLSESNQISCSSCHAPDLNWTDGREVSIGHDHAVNKRNAPSLENVWYFKRLFWDGRAETLEDQAKSPLSSDIEMHQDMKLLPKKIKKIKGYAPFFIAAFGSKEVTADKIFKSLADFQRTIVSRKSDFDRFLEGNKNSLTDQQLTGLHLFRTKAR